MPYNQAVSQLDTRCPVYVAPAPTTPPLHSQKTTSMEKCDAASFLSFPADLSNYVSALVQFAYPRAEPEIHRFPSNAGKKVRPCLWLRNQYLMYSALSKLYWASKVYSISSRSLYTIICGPAHHKPLQIHSCRLPTGLKTKMTRGTRSVTPRHLKFNVVETGTWRSG
jgi:hypothetical protein